MLSAALLDDEQQWRESTAKLLESYLSERPEMPACISVFSSSDELLRSSKAGSSVDVYILDVVMPGMGGIDVGLNLRKLDLNGVIIYLTTSKEYAVDSYMTNAFY